MSKYSVLIFDADETLFDYSRGEAYALERSISDAGITFQYPSHLETYHSINSRLWRDFEAGGIGREALKTERFRLLLQELGVESVDPADFGRRYLDHLGQTDFMLPGAAELLADLHSSFTLALLTNGFSQVQRSRIKKTETARYFDTIIISEEVDCQKPERRIFDILLEKLQWSDRRSVLMIGDSLSSDIQGGINAGIDTCWYDPGRRERDTMIQPTYVIRTLSDLKEIIRP